MPPGKGLPPHPPRPRNFLLGRGREILRHFPTEKVVDKWAWLLVFGHFLLLLSIGPLPLYTSSSAPHRWPEAKLRPETGAASVSWLKKDSCRLYKPQRIVAASPRVSSTPGPRERDRYLPFPVLPFITPTSFLFPFFPGQNIPIFL